MMVNDYNNPEPWQNLVPPSMPWMSSYDPSNSATQFGQPQATQLIPSPQPHTNMPINQSPQHQSYHHDAPFAAYPPTATTVTPPITTACPTSLSTIHSSSDITTSMSPPTGLILINPSSVSALTKQQELIPSTQHTAQELYDRNIFAQNLPFTPNQMMHPDTYNRNAISSCAYVCCNNQSAPETAIVPHKRTSMELDEDQSKPDRPTKQLLSEQAMLKRFGSLNIDNSECFDSTPNDDDDDDDTMTHKSSDYGRRELNHYVYLLFKDKKNPGTTFSQSDTTLDRLARAERDKLSKAVVLWNPPMKHQFFGQDDDNDDEDDDEFKYRDHEDFLKNPPIKMNSYTYNEPSQTTPSVIDSNLLDDVMLME